MNFRIYKNKSLSQNNLDALLDSVSVKTPTSLASAFLNATVMTSFPVFETEKVTDFTSAWQGCTGLTSFPLLDTSGGVNFTSAWNGCTSLTTFPANFFDSNLSATDYTNAFLNCSLTEASVNNILISLDASLATGLRIDIGGVDPSGDGIAARSSLVNKGWTVNIA